MTSEQEKLVTDNIKFVYYLFGKLKYKNKYFYKDDLISEGFIGLVKAAKAFNDSKGFKFLTFAARCINNSFYIYFRGLKRNRENAAISLSMPLEDSDSLTLEDTLSGQCEDEKILLNNDFNKFLATQRPGIQAIVKLREQGFNQTEIAKRLICSQTYVSKLLSRFRNCYLENKAN